MAVTCLTILAPPLGYALLDFYQLQKRAVEQATTGARFVRIELTRQPGADWLSVLHAAQGNENSAVVASWVTDKSGRMLMFAGSRAGWPEIRRQAAVTAPGFIGFFVVALTTREIFIETGVIALVFLLIGVAAHVCFRRLPLAALDAASEQLEGKQRELIARKAEVEEQNLLLDAALNNMCQGVAMFDADHRLMVCNELYRTIYSLSAEQVRPGVTARDILEARFCQWHVCRDRSGAVH
jgi:PAS domain-containing protein